MRTHIVLLADEDELSRGCMIFVLKEVMHAQPKILQTEFPEVFTSDRERIEVVFLKVSPKLAEAFLVFPPNEAYSQKEQRYDDRRDDVDPELALQRVDHECASIIHTCRVYDSQQPKAMRSDCGVQRTARYQWRYLLVGRALSLRERRYSRSVGSAL